MMRRPIWLAAGVAVGVGGTLWAEQRVRRSVRAARDRLAPTQLAAGAVDSVRHVGDRVKGAVEAGRTETARREDELWAGLEESGRSGTAVGHHAPGGRRARR